MDIRVSGHQVEVGEAFRAHAQERLKDVADKYFQRSLSASVTIGRQAHGLGFHVDCTMHVRHGVILKAEGNDMDIHIAFEQAAGRIEGQLRRYKRRLKSHHADTGKQNSLDTATYTVMESEAAEPDDDDGLPEAANAVIVAESATQLPEVSVSDAVMLMDLRHSPAMLFRNAGSGALAMVYRRTDGHIGWVEPRAS